MWLTWLIACSEYELEKQETEPRTPIPEILVEPSELEWETLGVNCAEDQLVTVTNVGSGPLTLADMVETYIDHAEDHAAQIVVLRRQFDHPQ